MAVEVAPQTTYDDPSFLKIADFINLTSHDWDIITEFKDFVQDAINGLSDATYALLVQFPETKAAIVSKRDPDTKSDNLGSLIEKRKTNLRAYLIRLFQHGKTDADLGQMIAGVAMLHKKHVKVGIEYMNGLLAALETVVIQATLTHQDLFQGRCAEFLMAMNKLMWLQNHVFIKVYSQSI
eukprot:Blabericola_migrator_1__11006@NODE_638_length_7121_cov_96_162603_g469_i0_p2_GENE_NODE_638_length_7121_cov_96_162603_g469_i0NODE_638_length_7121_cov_96_162603_g469_i0_p2_ORF_typecomplete_len181_score33_33Protoglobin/PF11563_8/1_7e23RBD/PF02196_15/0_3_NODE_638_length_7121_cov_96_162603_g469_i0236778